MSSEVLSLYDDDMASDENEELAYQLHLEDLLDAIRLSTISDDTPDFDAAPGNTKSQHKPAFEAAPGKAKSQDKPYFEAAARRRREELQLDEVFLEEPTLVREQQVWQDEEFARRIERVGSSDDLSSRSSSENQVYNLYFAESGDDRGYVGIGCVIKDVYGEVVLNSRECIGSGFSHHFAEYTALINGIALARSVGVRRINAYGSQAFMYLEVEGQANLETAEQWNSMAALGRQISELESFKLTCVSREENEAIGLANYAVEHETEIKSTSYSEEETKTCAICLENVFASDIVYQKACHHRFCYNCLSKWAENEISASQVPVRCPEFSECGRNLGDDDCRRLVSLKVFDTYLTRLTEASIPSSEKVFCPYPGCSAMMLRNDEDRADRNNTASSSTSTRITRNYTSAECMECHRLFCVQCQVPWHTDLTCQQYQALPPDERDAEDRKLFKLANDRTWKRCGKCRSLVILGEGCVHITCRCGNEFCYTCGINYLGNKKACKCPLFPGLRIF